MVFGKPILAAISLTALAVPPLAAQQRGYGTGAPHSVPAQRPVVPSASGGRPFPYTASYPTPPGLQAPAAAYTGILPGALNGRSGTPRAGYTGILPGAYNSNNRQNRNDRRGYLGVAPGFFASPYYYPFLDYGSAPYNGGYFDNSSDASNAQASLMIENSLGEQIQRLTAEVAELRATAVNSQAPVQNGLPADADATNTPAAKPITVVLQSGQQLEVGSYAIVNDTLWDFSKTPARRVPLSSIDVAASTKATEENGGEFPSIGGAGGRR